jgi:opacity protein-like surface antigen
VKYDKNTMNVSYIKAPLMLEFNTGKSSKNNFHIAVGAQFEYRIHSVLKQKYDQNDKHYKIKQRDDFNLEPFHYTATARIGYDNITLFANYGLNRLFKKDKGPQVYPLTVGVNLNF